MSDTPRTDGKLLSWNLNSAQLITACSKGSLGINGLNIQNRVVDADFARTLERENARLRGKVFALTHAGDAMDLLLTGSMKPTARIRDDWDAAKKLLT